LKSQEYQFKTAKLLEHLARTKDIKQANFREKTEGRSLPVGYRYRWEDSSNMQLRGMLREDVVWVYLTQDMQQ
jgi:hypothetical protein